MGACLRHVAVQPEHGAGKQRRLLRHLVVQRVRRRLRYARLLQPRD